MDLWLPGAVQVPRNPCGTMAGGGNRVVVWHSTEGTGCANYDPAAIAKSAQYPVHLWWQPNTGKVAQNFPADAKGCGLVTHNGDGDIVVQIEVCAEAIRPFDKTTPCLGLGKIVAWLDQLGIPRKAPAGNPPPSPAGYGLENGSRGAWGQSGYYTHSQVPDNKHSDPGAITWDALWYIADLQIAAEKPPPPPPPDPAPAVLGRCGVQATSTTRSWYDLARAALYVDDPKAWSPDIAALGNAIQTYNQGHALAAGDWYYLPPKG